MNQPIAHTVAELSDIVVFVVIRTGVDWYR